MFLLLNELGVEILVLLQISLQPGDLDVSSVKHVLLAIELGVQVGVLLLSIYQQVSLIVDLLSES